MRLLSSWNKARRSLWKLYDLLEVLHIVSDKYSNSTGPVSLAMDSEFTHKYWKDQDEQK